MKRKEVFNFGLVLLLSAFLMSSCATVEGIGGKPFVSSPEELSLPIGQSTTNDLFNGTTYLSQLVGNDAVFNSPGMLYVVFEPGVINKWHSHGGGQILIATDGIGYHQIEGQAVDVLYPGDVAKCPPDVKHWHGAAPGGWFAHIAIGTNPERQGFEAFDFVTETEYNTLPKE
jgi:quercetin dioxygenase-like cupin family protein/predicted small secreted protein